MTAKIAAFGPADPIVAEMEAARPCGDCTNLSAGVAGKKLVGETEAEGEKVGWCGLWCGGSGLLCFLSRAAGVMVGRNRPQNCAAG